MNDFAFRSLASKLFVLTALWVSFVVCVVAYTMYLGSKSETSYLALNRIDEIKVSFYRASEMSEGRLAAAGFEKEMSTLGALVENLSMDAVMPLAQEDAKAVKSALGRVVTVWRDTAAPALRIRATGRFVDGAHLNSFISALTDLKNTAQTCRAKFSTQMHILQGLIIVLSIGSLFVILFLLQRWVIAPVNRLGEAIDLVGKNNLSVRVPVESNDEFGRIGEGFNLMAERLEDLYENLEAKVAEQTASVREKNANLTQLYEMAAFLSEVGTIDDMSEGFIERVMACSGADACSVRLLNKEDGSFPISASSGLPGQCLELEVHDEAAAAMRGDLFSGRLPSRHKISPGGSALGAALYGEGFRSVCIFQIGTDQDTVGVYELFFKGKGGVQEQYMQQLESFGTHLGTAIDNNLLNEKEKQLAIVQERSLIAQGLHDSIAQTLSFLNIQVQVLESSLESGDKPMIAETVTQIKAGIQESYDNVRELLLNFRDRVHKKDFRDLITTIVKRFEIQSGVKTSVEYRGAGPQLTEREKTQVTFIIQEAFSNIRKHANTKTAELLIENGKDFVATVTDHGRGIDLVVAAERKKSHVGLSIMDERASKIGAKLEIESAPGLGTKVRVTIPRGEASEGGSASPA